MTPLRIVYAVPDFEPAVGGTTRQAGAQARELVRRGHEVTVVTRRYDPSWPRVETIGGLRVHRLGRPGRGTAPEKEALAAAASWLAHRRRDVDIVQAVMWPDVTLSAGVIGLASKTVLLWATSGDAGAILRPGRSLARRFQGALRQAVYSRARHVALTPSMARELEDVGVRRPVTIPVPLDTTRFRPPSPSERAQAREHLELGEAFVVAFVGHLVRRKGPELLVEAVARLIPRQPATRLLFVGGGGGQPDDVEESVRRLARERLGAGTVTFLGPLPDPRPVLWAADAFVLPSFREGMPNSVLEAMACGLPCVVPPSAGGGDLLDADTGIVPPTNAAHHLRDALATLAEDPARRRELGRRAGARARLFGVEAVVDRYEALYDDVVRAYRLQARRRVTRRRGPGAG